MVIAIFSKYLLSAKDPVTFPTNVLAEPTIEFGSIVKKVYFSLPFLIMLSESFQNCYSSETRQ